MMKRNAFLTLLLFFIVGTAAVSAQTPLPKSDTLQDPVEQGDPAVQSLPQQMDYVTDMKRIISNEIPAPVRKTLESSAQYTDWEKALIYQSKTKDEYLILFKDAEKTTSYRFDKNGKPVEDN